MRKCTGVILAGMLLAVSASGTRAASIALAEWALNIAGTVSEPTLGDPIPAGVDVSGFDDATGLGTLTTTFTPGAPGDFFVGAFFDHEIVEPMNTFFNETGAVSGAPAPGQSWEIDEPGFVNGDIFANFEDSALDNGIGTSVFGNTTFPDDVSMAMGWNFTLADGEFAVVDFLLSESAPLSGFSLSHTDPDSNDVTVYFSSNMNVVPEPGTVILMGTSLLVGLLVLRRKRLQGRARER